MTTRILDAIGPSLANANRKDLLAAIRKTAGRTVVAETVTFKAPLIDGVTNAELLKSLGADMVNINHYNHEMPMMPGLVSTPVGLGQWNHAWSGSEGSVPAANIVEDCIQDYILQLGFGRTLKEVKELVGIPVGMTLDPVAEDTESIPRSRVATVANAAAAVEHGASFITLIQTPKSPGELFTNATANVRKGAAEACIVKVGKMPWGDAFGLDFDEYITAQEIERLAKAGADVVIIPSPGTVPGSTVDVVRSWVNVIHGQGLLAEVTIGTSQEGAATDVIHRFAIDAKMTGADLYQIGDGVYSGVSQPENVQAFSTAIKGIRHTLRRGALSPKR